MFNDMLEKRLSGNVKRFHTVPVIQEHLVSSHSWGVALCVLAIQPACRKELLVASLLHDATEHVTGDLPAYTKWNHPELASAMKNVERKVRDDLGYKDMGLTPYEIEILKTADMSDLILCCLLEWQLGNKGIEQVIKVGLGFLDEYCEQDAARAFVEELEIYVMKELDS